MMGATPTPTCRTFGVRGAGRIVEIGLGAVLLLAGCSGGSDSGSQGPAAVADGSYQLLGTSASQAPDATVSLQISGDSVVLTTQGTATVEGTLGQPRATEYVLCPPDGKGAPRPLGKPVEVGGVQLVSPALFGDCGQTKPVRVTLVDLDATTGDAFPFQNWAEFCDTKDPEC